MRPLTIELKKGEPSRFRSVAWKTSDDYRREFYALDQAGKPVVITPKPALPDSYFPIPKARAVFSRDPFPAAVCVEISPCRLLPPPCYKSKEDFDGQLPCHYHFEPWKAIYWETHGQIMYLEPSDDCPLQEQLNIVLAEMNAAYEEKRLRLRAEIDRLTTKQLPELGYQHEEQRNKRIADLQAYLANVVESELPIDNEVCKGRLNLTLEDIKNNREGIRDEVLHKDWAGKFGWNLAEMRRERMVYRRWLETHTGTPSRAYDMETREWRNEIAPPGFGERYEQDPRFLEACALVRYRARFADNANTVVYLADCEQRKELTAQELDEVVKLKGDQTTPQPASGPGAATPVEANGLAQLTELRVRSDITARLNSDYSVATIPQASGELLHLAIEIELQSLLKRIMAEGGTIPRTKLREDKPESFQPEKLLRSQTAQALVKAGLLGRQQHGRTTVFWAKAATD